MSTVATLDQRRFGRAEKRVLEAEDFIKLESAWSAHGYAEGTPEYAALLEIYQDRSARFAIEAGKYLRA